VRTTSSRVCQVTLDLLQERHAELLTRTVVRKYVAFPEAQLRGLPVFGIAPGSAAAAAYQSLARELNGLPPDLAGASGAAAGVPA